MQSRSFILNIIWIAISTVLSTVFLSIQSPIYAQTPVPKVYWTRPDNIPPMNVTKSATMPTAEGYLFLSPYERRRGTSQYDAYLMIVDNDGELVYYYKNDSFPTDHYHDFKVLSNGLLLYIRRIHRFMNSSYEIVGSITSVDSKPDFHDIELLPNGNYMLLTYRDRSVDLSKVIEDGDPNGIYVDCYLQEIDPNGNLLFEWRSEDHFAISDTYKSLLASYIDGVHCNSVDLDTDGNLIISSRDMYEVTKINKETGELIWRLGGKNNQFEFINAIDATDITFDKQHDARRTPNGNLTLFDNRVDGKYSRAVEYELDEENMTATLVWEHRHTPDVHASILGNTQRLPNGNTLISWGSSRTTLTEVTRDGTTLLEMSLPSDMATYRSYRFPWVGHPTTQPDLVVVREVISGTNANDLANTTALKLAYSWNGATEVAAYNVYGDGSAQPNTMITTESRTGFETITTITGNDAVTMLEAGYNFRVVPLDSNGQVFPVAPDDPTSPERSSSAISVADAVIDMVTQPSIPASTPPAMNSSTPTPTSTALPALTPPPAGTSTPTSTPTKIIIMPTRNPIDSGTISPPLPTSDLAFSLTIDPNSLNDQDQASPGDPITFIIKIVNIGTETIFDLQLVGTIPLHTTFNQSLSDPRWTLLQAPLSAASKNDTCPEGGANVQCIISLGDLVPKRSMEEITFTVVIDTEVPEEVTNIALPIKLSGANIDGMSMDFLLDNSVDVLLGTSPTDDLAAPTGLDTESEPRWERLYLPIIGR